MLEGRRTPFIAAEGILFLLATAILTVVVWHFRGAVTAALPAALFIYLFFIFRDPRRQIPAIPLGVVSPADGVVVDVGVTDKGIVDGESHRIVIRVNSLGTYTARCPIEGKIMDLHGEPLERIVTSDKNGLWVRSADPGPHVPRSAGTRVAPDRSDNREIAAQRHRPRRCVPKDRFFRC